MSKNYQSKPADGKKKAVYAKKSFGQNFLIDPNYTARIIAALDPAEKDIIVEIGSGRGALTEVLIESGANVIAVELERQMIAVLRERFQKEDNFQLIESDALKVDFSTFLQPPASKLKLVANLPYNVSTAILQKLIEQKDCFSEMVLMFQREVVERISADAGNAERGFLTLLVEAHLQAEKLFDVPPNAFFPVPKVWSSVVRLTPKTDFTVGDEQSFRQIVSAGFRQKRKTIYNNLKSVFVDVERVFTECSIDKQRRAETLTLEEWICLASQKGR